MPIILFGTLLLHGCGVKPPADIDPGHGRMTFDAWVAVGQDSTGAIRPAVIASVPYRHLVFKRDGEMFSAGLEVRVLAWRNAVHVGGGVARGTVELERYAETGANVPLEVSVPVLIRGDDQVSLEVEAQVLGTTRTWRRYLNFTPKIAASMPLWIADLNTNLAKRSDGALLAESDMDSLRLTISLRPQRNGPSWPDGGIDLLSEIDGPSLAHPRRKRTAVPACADTLAVCTIHHVWPIDRLPLGRLRIRVFLEAEHAGHRWQLPREPALSFASLNVPLLQDRDWRRHLTWLDGLLSAAYRDSMQDIPAARRAEAWAEIWRIIAGEEDLDPLVAERIHLLRIISADDRFGGFARGALSDRGRVFIRWGEPAQIDVYLDDRVPGAVYEVWFHPAAGMRFIFYDAHGNGDFRLRRTEPLPR